LPDPFSSWASARNKRLPPAGQQESLVTEVAIALPVIGRRHHAFLTR